MDPWTLAIGRYIPSTFPLWRWLTAFLNTQCSLVLYAVLGHTYHAMSCRQEISFESPVLQFTVRQIQLILWLIEKPIAIMWWPRRAFFLLPFLFFTTFRDLLIPRRDPAESHITPGLLYLLLELDPQPAVPTAAAWVELLHLQKSFWQQCPLVALQPVAVPLPEGAVVVILGRTVVVVLPLRVSCGSYLFSSETEFIHGWSISFLIDLYACPQAMSELSGLSAQVLVRVVKPFKLPSMPSRPTSRMVLSTIMTVSLSSSFVSHWQLSISRHCWSVGKCGLSQLLNYNAEQFF